MENQKVTLRRGFVAAWNGTTVLTFRSTKDTCVATLGFENESRWGLPARTAQRFEVHRFERRQ